MSKTRQRLIHDVSVVLLSILIALLLVKTRALEGVLGAASNVKFLGSFIAGMFFTSVFTTPVSIVALGQISLGTSPWIVALFGSFGAVVGDMVIFAFMKDHLVKDAKALLGHPHHRRKHAVFRYKFFRFLTFFLGALVIASPLPDELGLAMMGMSKVKPSVLIPVSLVMNFIGILLIGLAANALQ